MSKAPKTVFRQLFKTLMLSMMAFIVFMMVFYLFASMQILPTLTHAYLNKIAEYASEENYYLIVADDPIGNQEYVENLKQIPWLSFAEISNEQSNTAYSIGNNEWDSIRAIKNTEFKDTENQVHIKKPIYTEQDFGQGERLGVLHIAIDKTPINTLKRTVLGIILLSAVAGFIISIPHLRSLTNRFTKPIRQLANQLNDIDLATGHTTPIKIGSAPTELQIIADAANRQLHRLKNYNEEREQIIEKRTAELKNALEKLTAAEQEKSALISGLSHDLKTPLTSLLGFVELANEELEVDDQPAAKDALVIAERKANELHGEINRLLSYLSGLRDDDAIELSPFDIENLVNESILGISRSHAISNNTVKYQHEGDKIVRTDKTKLQHVIDNLITNAFKYCRDGQIKIKTLSSSHIYFEITDCGIGIEKDKIARIFDVNYQAGTSLKMDDRGHGLGLHLCMMWVKKMGGEITVESEINKGSIFKVRIPNKNIAKVV